MRAILLDAWLRRRVHSVAVDEVRVVLLLAEQRVDLVVPRVTVRAGVPFVQDAAGQHSVGFGGSGLPAASVGRVVHLIAFRSRRSW
jgi:hypothetical protein